MDAVDERELVRLCRAGKVSAYEPLVRGNEREALRIATALLGDPDEAADAVQDAFVKGFRSLAGLREGSPFRPWFRTILHNDCRDRLRSAARHERLTGDSVATHSGGWARSVPDPVERDELSAGVQAALARLSPEHREVLVLKELEEFSYAEIARATGVSEGTVASRLYHARSALRRTLEEHGITLESVP